MAAETNIPLIDHSHQMRYFFANEIAFNNGVDLKTVSTMLSHESVKTTEIYVKPNKRNISESMKMVKKKLFREDGSFKPIKVVQQPDEKPVEIMEPANRKNPLRVVYLAGK